MGLWSNSFSRMRIQGTFQESNGFLVVVFVSFEFVSVDYKLLI
jgi:hypothetical protein